MAAPKHLTSILLPSWNRARQLRTTLQAIYDTVYDESIEVLVSLVAGDEASRKMVVDFPVRVSERTLAEAHDGAVYAWNTLAQQAHGDVFALFADDLIPQEHWLARCLLRLDLLGGDGLIGFNDLGTDGHVFAAHWIASRRFLVEHNGGVIYPPQYFCWWCDREISDRAQALHRHAFAQEAIVEHRHYTFGKSAIDATYQNGIEHHESDRLLYEQRKAHGFPNNFAPVIKSEV